MRATLSTQAGYWRLPIALRWQLVLLGAAVVGLIVVSNGFLRESLQADRGRVAQETEQREQLELLRDVQKAVRDYRLWLIEAAAQGQLNPSPTSSAWLEQARTALDANLDKLATFDAVAAAEVRRATAGLDGIASRALQARDANGGGAAQQQLRAAGQRLARVDASLEKRVADQRAAVEAVAGSAVQVTDRAIERSWWTMLGASAVAIVLVLLILQSTLPALRKTIDAIDELVRGHFEAPLPPIARDELGEVARGLRNFRDNARQLEVLATTDALTELGTRLEMQQVLDKCLDEMRDGRVAAALLFMDLDQFKSVNDALGHSAGDRYLQEVARRLRRALPHVALISRISGDEFGVLIRELADTDGIREVSERAVRAIADAFSHNCLLEGQPVAISASIGIAIAQRDGWSGDVLLARAEAAMYAAKGDGRGQHRYYDPAMTDGVRDQLAIGGALRRAIADNNLRMVFQPIVDATTLELVGAEALVRWTDPELGVVNPERFVPIAEETQIIVELGEWVMHAVGKQLAQWREAGLSLCPVAVNIGARHFADHSLLQTLTDVLGSYSLPPDALELEITESAVVRNPERSIELMHAIRARGVRLSLDDFGTGYSSLAYLQRFPLDKLKVDQSFVKRVAESADSDNIVAATIGLAQRLGLTTVGEGVESHAVLRRLQAHQCDLIQGYFTGRPMPAEDFSEWLVAQRQPDSIAV